MKKTTRNLLALSVIVISFVVSHPVKAQDRKEQMAEMIKNSTPEQRAKMQTGMMKTKLNLDSAMGLKVYDINLKYAKKLDPVIKGDSKGFAKLREMKAIDADKDKELKATLTPDQYRQYEAAKEEMKEKMKERMQERKAKS
jgi:hypothetical protein